MKKKRVLILAALVLAVCIFAACSEQKTVVELEGYVAYENTEIGYKIQYPTDYIFIDSSMTEAQRDLVNDLLPSSIVENIDMGNMQAAWYSETAYKNSGANMNLLVAPMPGFTQQSFKSAADQKQLEETVVEVNSPEFSDFTIVKHMEGKTFGNNYFVTYTASYDLLGVKVYLIQAMTFGNGNCYTFSLGSINEDTLADMPAFETILSTLEFIE